MAAEEGIANTDWQKTIKNYNGHDLWKVHLTDNEVVS